MIEQKLYQIPTATIIYEGGEAYVPWLDESEEVQLLPISVIADDGEFADVQGDLTTEHQIIKNY